MTDYPEHEKLSAIHDASCPVHGMPTHGDKGE